MGKLNENELREFVNSGILEFHRKKIERLKNINLEDILRKKNPYLFKAKNITIASDLIINIMDAFLFSSEEKLFGDFLEQLAIFIASCTSNGYKSSAQGIDLEFSDNDIHFIVSVKSGPNWGNSSQYKRQEDDFKRAVKVLKQANPSANIQPVLGICYGKSKDSFNRGYLKTMGQNFWFLLSKKANLYTDIIEPLGYRARENNAVFEQHKSELVNKFTESFIAGFCTDGSIDWKKLVEFNSGNLPK